MSNKQTRVVFWISTLLFAIPLAWSAIQYLIEAPRMMATMTHLGYPVYFIKILGIAKLLGVAVLLYRHYPTLTEWAYAGFAFDTLGAFLSHLSVGDALPIALIPLAFFGLLMISYRTGKRIEPVVTSPGLPRRAIPGASLPARG